MAEELYTGLDRVLAAFFSRIKNWLPSKYKKQQLSFVLRYIEDNTTYNYYELLHFEAPSIKYVLSSTVEGCFFVETNFGSSIVKIRIYVDYDNNGDVIPVIKEFSYNGYLHTANFISSLRIGYDLGNSTDSRIRFGIYGYCPYTSSYEVFWKITPISLIVNSKEEYSNKDSLSFFQRTEVSNNKAIQSIPYKYTATIKKGSITVESAETASSATRSKTSTEVDGAVADCVSAAGTAAKTAFCTNFSLKVGAQVFVRFANSNTASKPTLNINNTGAKTIFVNGAIATNNLVAGTYLFTYDGTYWRCLIGKAPYQFDTSSGTLTVNY